MNNSNRSILWITRTAVFTALLIVTQAVTAPLGNTLVTGSAVNLILIVSVMLCGLTSGLTVAALSPVLARLFGIGPQLWMLIPFIIAGNLTISMVWHMIGNRKSAQQTVTYIIAAISGAICKFLVLYVGVAQIAVPFILGLPQPQAGVISNMFSLPQLFTATIGGALAVLILPILKKAVKAD